MNSNLPYGNSERCKCKHLNQNHYDVSKDSFGRLEYLWDEDRRCVITHCSCKKFVPDSNLDYLEWKYDQKKRGLTCTEKDSTDAK